MPGKKQREEKEERIKKCRGCDVKHRIELWKHRDLRNIQRRAYIFIQLHHRNKEKYVYELCKSARFKARQAPGKSNRNRTEKIVPIWHSDLSAGKDERQKRIDRKIAQRAQKRISERAEALVFRLADEIEREREKEEGYNAVEGEISV